MTRTPLAVSLFTGAGIGDVGLRAAGLEYLLMLEQDPRRSAIAAANFPAAKVLTGDIWDLGDQVVDLVSAQLQTRDQELFLVSCTAPCQGMSKSGRGSLLHNAKLGKRPSLDPRNRLILPALDVIARLRPLWVVFENVVEMTDTWIEDEAGQLRQIPQIISERLAPEYVGKAYAVEFADYGIPQRRKRLITVLTRTEVGRAVLTSGGEFIPGATHSSTAGALSPWVAVADVLVKFPALDARSPETARDESVAFHRVPLLDERKYEWVARTPPGASAFDNQCASCGHADNSSHTNVRVDGVNRSSKSTPILCVKCDALLPRPHVIVSDEPRIMRGFTSAYKRMPGHLPAPALTRNLSYACSDQKLHPTQNRVLSLAEAFTVHTLDRYDFTWSFDDRTASDAVVRLCLGESIPPQFTQLLGTHLLAIDQHRASASE